MPLVAPLGRGEGALGGEAVALVRLALQRGEVVQQRRLLDQRLALDRLDDRGGALGERGDAIGVLGRLEAVRGALLPHAHVLLAGGGLELRLHLPVVLGHERVDLEVAPHDHRERRRLHAAERDRRAGRPDAGRRRAGRVHADQPVGLGAGARGILERSQIARRRAGSRRRRGSRSSSSTRTRPGARACRPWRSAG